MAQYASKDLVVQFDNASAVLTTMTQYIRDIGGVKIEAILADSHAFGDTWFKSVATGIKKTGDITLSGYYDDTATSGPDAIFNAVGNTTTRTLKLTWGGTKTTQVQTIIMSYERMPKLGDMTGFVVTLKATGTVTEV